MIALIGVSSIGTPALAQTPPNPVAVPVDAHAALMATAKIQQLMRVVATEGARHGVGLEQSLFPGKGGAAWMSTVSIIQGPDRMTDLIADVLRDDLSPADARTAATFLGSDLGQRVVDREVMTRQRMLDAKADARAATAPVTRPGRAALIEDIIARLGLIEANVSGGLNANLAFYRGLADGGAFKARLTEREMISLVWTQEADMRAASADWLRGYLTRAYAPLSEAELKRYVAFTDTDVGRRYSAAMIRGFDAAFETTSYDLGRAAARFMAQKAI